MRSNKALALLSLAGLALAFTITIPIACNIGFHRSFDRFHPDYDRIYNLYINEMYHGTRDIYGELPLSFGEYIKALFPEVENMVRTKDQSDVLVSTDDKKAWKEDILWVDPSFKDIFYLKLLSGDITSSLQNPDKILISASLSDKIFGDTNIIGEKINISGKAYQIEGIFRDYPGNSHMKFSVLIPLISRIPKETNYEWDSYEFLTYLKLRKGTDSNKFENKLQSFLKDYWIPWNKSHYNLDYVFNNENNIKLKLMPVADIHLNGSFISSFENESNSSVIIINITILLVLLLIAYFNLIGFTISKTKKHRYNLIIMHRLGSSRISLISTFIFENIIYSIFSFIIGFLIFYEIWNYNPLLLVDLKSIQISNFIFPVALLFLFAIIVSILSGTLTGIYLSRQSTKTSASNSQSYSQFWFNRLLIVAQMASSIILILCITGIYKQLKYLSSYDIGIKKGILQL